MSSDQEIEYPESVEDLNEDEVYYDFSDSFIEDANAISIDLLDLYGNAEDDDPDWVDQELEIDDDGIEFEIEDDSEYQKTLSKNRANFKKLIEKQRKSIGLVKKEVGIDSEEQSIVGPVRLGDLVDLSSKLEMRRSLGSRFFPKTTFSKAFVPNSRGLKSKVFGDRVYSGQFSEDGTFFYACTQDFNVRLFSTLDDKLKEVKTVKATFGQWTITDATLSNDNKWLVYSSITPIAYMTKTLPEETEYIPLSFYSERGEDFGIWSLRFSPNGKEVVAGTNKDSLMVYSLEADKVILDVKGHTDDVNAVCFADISSHVLYSGSDDSLIKVWDRRSLDESHPRPAGVFLGHTSGITYVSSKGDGRYCISNSKDQSMKLWDIRRLVQAEEFDMTTHAEHVTDFDYRFSSYPYNYPQTHPNDRSVMTYTGHKVLNTLIRCHFSPASSTNQRYLYSGSSDGKIHIYNWDGSVAQILDTNLATTAPDDGILNSSFQPANFNQDESPDEFADGYSSHHHVGARFFEAVLGRLGGFSRPRPKVVVRDVAWHPWFPYLLASCWDRGRGALIRHKFTTESKQLVSLM